MRAPRTTRSPFGALALTAALTVVVSSGGCGPSTPEGGGATGETAPFEPITVPPPSSIADAPLDPATISAVGAAVASPVPPPPGTVDTLVAAGDVRLAWVLTDLLRLDQQSDVTGQLIAGLTTLVGAPPAEGQDPWVAFTDLLVRWDVPAPDGYATAKRDLLVAYEPGWAGLLEDVATEGLDWRRVAPGDAAPGEVTGLSGPAMVAGEGGRWLPDSDRVVGMELDGQFRAYPVRVLAAHEVVTDEIGPRRVAVVNDPVSGTIAAYDIGRDAAVAGVAAAELDGNPPVELGISGLTLDGVDLLVDTTTGSLVEPISGRGVTGSWWSASVGLDRVPFTLTTWREWRSAHPSTFVVAADGGVGRLYLTEPFADVPAPARALGEVDARLGPGARVLGVEAPDGTPVAFPVELVELSLVRGDEVSASGVGLSLDAGGLALWAEGPPGEDRAERLAGVVTSWADWSRIHPETAVWDGVG